jgi:hypothetical protein
LWTLIFWPALSNISKRKQVLPRTPWRLKACDSGFSLAPPAQVRINT